MSGYHAWVQVIGYLYPADDPGPLSVKILPTSPTPLRFLRREAPIPQWSQWYPISKIAWILFCSHAFLLCLDFLLFSSFLLHLWTKYNEIRVLPCQCQASPTDLLKLCYVDSHYKSKELSYSLKVHHTPFGLMIPFVAPMTIFWLIIPSFTWTFLMYFCKDQLVAFSRMTDWPRGRVGILST